MAGRFSPAPDRRSSSSISARRSPTPESDVGADFDLVVANTRNASWMPRRRTAVPVFFFRLAYRHDLSDAGIILCQAAGSSPVSRKGPRRPRSTSGSLPVPTSRSSPRRRPVPSSERTSRPSLITLGIDTLVLTGCSTSGCVRAAAVDGYSYGYRLLVPADCVGDRTIEAHQANLFDIQVKMGRGGRRRLRPPILSAPCPPGPGDGDAPIREGDRRSLNSNRQRSRREKP